METVTAKTSIIWDEFGSNLKKFILKRISNKSDADDILQDVFVKIHLNLEKLQSDDKLVSWVFTIARNAINDYYRKPKYFTDIDSTVFDNLWVEYDRFEINDIKICVQPFIESLPDIYKEALLAIDIDKMPQNEFAKLKGIGYSAAKSRVQRAREMLKENISRCCEIFADKYGNIVDYKERRNCSQIQKKECMISKKMASDFVPARLKVECQL